MDMSVGRFRNAEGMVGVLVSPGFGSGWSTWGKPEHAEVMLFCPELVEYISQHIGPTAVSPEVDMLRKYTGDDLVLCCCFEDLIVVWVAEGTKFRIAEHDGFESVEIIGEGSVHVA